MNIPAPHKSFATYAGQLLGIFQKVVIGHIESFEGMRVLYATSAKRYEDEGRTEKVDRLLDLIKSLEDRIALYREVRTTLSERRRQLNLSRTKLAGWTVGPTAAIDAFARMILPNVPVDQITDEMMDNSLCTQILSMVADVDVMKKEGASIANQMVGAVGDMAGSIGGMPPGILRAIQLMMSGGHLSTKTGEPTYPIVEAFLGMLFEDPPVPEGDAAALETPEEQAARHAAAEHAVRSRDEVLWTFRGLPTTVDSLMEAYRAKHPDVEIEAADFATSPCQENIIAALVMMTAVTLTHITAQADPGMARAHSNITRSIVWMERQSASK